MCGDIYCITLSMPHAPPHAHSFGLSPAAPLQVWTPLQPNQGNDASLPVNPGGWVGGSLYVLTCSHLHSPCCHLPGVQVARMDPLCMLQVAVKNNVGVFYFSSLVPVNVLLTEDGKMGGCGGACCDTWSRTLVVPRSQDDFVFVCLWLCGSVVHPPLPSLLPSPPLFPSYPTP